MILIKFFFLNAVLILIFQYCQTSIIIEPVHLNIIKIGKLETPVVYSSVPETNTAKIDNLLFPQERYWKEGDCCGSKNKTLQNLRMTTLSCNHDPAATII